ncbi:Ribonuclease E [compost metagenome]
MKPVEVVEAEQPVAQESIVDVQPEPKLAPVQPVPQVETAPAQPVVTHVIKHATAPMTKAPAPDYNPEAPRQSDWVRPTYEFSGRGSAGANSATHQATAPATRPQSAE